MSDAAVKEAVHLSDQLLAEVFAYGSRNFEEEQISRINVEKGDSYDNESCTYVNDAGGMYGKIAEVWLHGLRDEKRNGIYKSYVEGEQ